MGDGEASLRSLLAFVHRSNLIYKHFIIVEPSRTGNTAMPPPYALVLAGALFKKRVRGIGADGAGARSREKAIREKVVDDLRGREDSLRERETALAAREEEHGRKSAELALRLQELAVRESRLKDRSGEGAAAAGRAGEHHLPPDSDTPEEQERLVKALEHRLAGARARHDELRRKTGARGRLAETIAAYRSSGYVVSRLEGLGDLSPAELERALDKFEREAALLGPLAARCDALDRAVEKEAESLRARCNDPDAVAEIENGIQELERQVKARRERLRERMERWRSGGFSLARLEKLAGAGLVALEEAATRYEEDLEVLRLFGEKLDALEPSAKQGASRLVPLLKDPDNIPALEKEFLAIEKQAGVRRQEFLELYEKWRSEGVLVEPLDKVLTADLPAMRSAFLRFDEDLHRLRALAERASRLDASFATRVAALRPGLRDPAQLQVVEKAVREMEEEAGKAPAAPARRGRAPPPKVVAAPKEPAAPPPAVEARAVAAPVQPAAGEAAPAGNPQAELSAEIAAAEAAIKELELKGIDPAAAFNLLKLGKSFNRSKNLAKALLYAKKARETAIAMKK